MYICEKCGRVIESGELPTYKQCHGFTTLGEALVEMIDGTCSCGGEYIEAERCKICGGVRPNNDMCHGVCSSCIKENETVGEALDWGKELSKSVDINGFVAYVLSEEQINKILAKWCEENFVDGSKDVVEFCELDKSEFVDHIAEKYGD